MFRKAYFNLYRKKLEIIILIRLINVILIFWTGFKKLKIIVFFDENQLSFTIFFINFCKN